MEWKELIKIEKAKGQSFAYPEKWKELKIYSIVDGGTLCVLEVNIINNIITDEIQYISDTIYANTSSFDTIIFSFYKAGVTVHNAIRNGLSDGINCTIHAYYR